MARILIMASDGYEQSELLVPLEKLEAAGHEVEIAAPLVGEVRAWDRADWGRSVKAGVSIGDAVASDYDALVLPGGVINPDTLRHDEKAIGLIRDFASAARPIAAICHAPWLLIEAGLAKGRRMTSYVSIRTDIGNAGADVVDESVVVDRGVITSRNPGDLDDFVEAIKKAVA
ncbi:type 1 glutamine amidotransferase domain-containing protein [Paracoccus salsus]|uniref:type 1 glutamine amidotransferase domain-containing protein n=1 Tax=Paracoccus salsus TaxID=2911061 RepID=UPI001F48111C|nr:type 1 glutamine amidotransferase domain-containing protein [Paracoccus salsus]MCF3972836.1 type 1 glutamine amidotransferase [Paracoccus salsus]